ncbi:MAG: Ig-like domain-containing protein [Lachnospiraceae bacterium]|nr:Ig-like domain-containing protein [Lachnospiraceae bacterium]
MKIRKYLAWLLVFALVFSLITGNTAQVMAKSRKAAVIKSVSLKIGKKEVTKKTYTMKQGEKKKLKVTVSPKKGKKTIKFTTGNKKVATVSKSGTITAKKAGTAKIKVTVKAGNGKAAIKKTTWMKVKVTKPSSTDKNTTTEQPETPNPVVEKKSIVVYFSCTDNTKTVAEYIKDSTASDIYRIEPSVPYTSADLNYGNADSRTSKEQNDATARPQIAGNLPNLSGYEVVYLGYPIWWGEAPKIMYTFVESYDLSGKIIIPFCTSGSSGIGKSATNLQTVTKGNATWIAGQRFAGSSSKSEIQQWVQGLDLSKTTSATGTLVTPDDSTQTPDISEPPSVTEDPVQTPEPTETPDVPAGKKSIVVYFSCTDNTKTIAEYVAESTDADIYRIEPSVPYTSADLNYGNADSRTSKEQNDATARPDIAGSLPSLTDYEIVYLGYPIWWGQAPKILYTFVENCNLSGKIVIPFCTSASSGIGTSATNLQAADTSQAMWLTGRRFSGSSPKSDVGSWISELELQ